MQMSEKPYRGKRTDGFGWVKGYYVHLHEDGYKEREVYRIYTGEAVLLDDEYYTEYREVDPATVGRYTGYTDDYQTSIFEGDKLSTQGFFPPHEEKVGVVVFEEGMWKIDYGEHCYLLSIYRRSTFDLRVVGNIHDETAQGEPEIPGSLSEHIMSRFERVD